MHKYKNNTNNINNNRQHLAITYPSQLDFHALDLTDSVVPNLQDQCSPFHTYYTCVFLVFQYLTKYCMSSNSSVPFKIIHNYTSKQITLLCENKQNFHLQ